MGVAHSSSIWCESDNHHLYEKHSSFNMWLDEKGESDDTIAKYGLAVIGTPSKALFAGDYPAYLEAVLSFSQRRLHSALGKTAFEEHWFNRNLAHFEELLDALKSKSVVPFIGAGVSCSSGYSSWKAHLIAQGKTAGLGDIGPLLDSGQYEEVMQQVLRLPHGRNLFIDNLKVDFLKRPSQLELQTMVLALCPHVVITTNYDRCLELAAAQRGEGEVEPIYAYSADTQPLIASLSHRRRAILKLHGDIKSASECILSSDQYDAAYGTGYIDMDRPLPRKLRRVYESNSLLFIGCSLHFDRTLQVFQKVMDERGASDIPPHFAIIEAPTDASDLVRRNKSLSDVGIIPIFYPSGEHFKLKEILSCVKDELTH
ncbi:SIR2 family protein [Rhizobium leguminosarum]|uniref:SIR2 family NAD-dependent protein deacylase n=1 Tax=Rhizobium leguminosarum TaxID=384 RepID=UPI00102F6A5E|nr:SIR2 family protein [Rhizobium leguminosarum]TAZ59942.1 SIR2 family protein [Rhizobium leguminosarum]